MDFSWLEIPSQIFFAEVCVVTLATLRTIYVARGQKMLAPILGFFEITLWLFAIGRTMQNLDNWTCFIAFAIGFALGNYFGISIEKWLAIGTVIVRIITHRDAGGLIEKLRAANFGVTCIDGEGASGQVQIVMTVIKRKQLGSIAALIQENHPGAFYAVDDVQSANEGIFPSPKAASNPIPVPIFKMLSSLTNGVR
jgi:uncharacterized protein YebE (UPF0316 family)